MTRFLIGALLGAAIALSPVASGPARAEGLSSSDLAKILGGLALVGIIGAQIHENRKGDKREKTVQRRYQPRAYVTPKLYRPDRYRPQSRRIERLLPARCMHRIDGSRHERTVFGAECLQRSGAYRHLPRHCAMRVHAYGRPREVFGARCLAREGWAVARHR